MVEGGFPPMISGDCGSICVTIYVQGSGSRKYKRSLSPLVRRCRLLAASTRRSSTRAPCILTHRYCIELLENKRGLYYGSQVA